MLTAVVFAAVLSFDGGQAVSVVAGTPAPAEARPEGDTRRVWRLKRGTGSNMQQRVCRNIRVAGVQDQQTRDFMRHLQRIRFPDDGATAAPGGPNGG